MRPGGSLAAAFAVLAAACAPRAVPSADPASPAPATPRATALAELGTYTQPNVRDGDGTPAFVHVTERDMPLVVSIGIPPQPPRYGSRADARRAAIEAMRQWEAAIAPHLPWFRLEFVEDDPGAAVLVHWKRRIPGPWGGFGWLRFERTDDGLRVGGEMQISTTPRGDLGLETRLSVDEVRLLVAHEFGHVLGLGHCLECDSAMNYQWETRDLVIVTDLDVRTFLELVSRPNGTRVDGRPLVDFASDEMPPR